jgi:sigma-B regulation protein RsbU (phosphoserine phosphatase)
MLELFIDLSQTLAVVLVVAYIVFHTRLTVFLFKGKNGFSSGVILTVIFGLFSIYGTLGGVNVLGAVSNIRDLGPLVAGLLAGPFVGMGAGLIGAFHRYSTGGFTAVSCSLATVVAGLLGGIIYLCRKRMFPRILPALLLGAFEQLIHSTLSLLIARPFERAWEVSIAFTPAMMLVNALGLAGFSFIFYYVAKEPVRGES